jgi:Holliday junction DNA helicase RuvA
MIYSIRGPVTQKLLTSVVIELGGLGYEVVVAASDHARLTVGAEAQLWLYESIREDSHTLYGFAETAAKTLFEELLGVSGIGPKVALAVMSAAPADKLRQAIASGDPDLLRGIAGVGKKTAERILVELKGKVGPGGGISSTDAALQALIGLGYSSAQAAEAIATISPDISDDQDRIKAALKVVSK